MRQRLVQRHLHRRSMHRRVQQLLRDAARRPDLHQLRRRRLLRQVPERRRLLFRHQVRRGARGLRQSIRLLRAGELYRPSVQCGTDRSRHLLRERRQCRPGGDLPLPARRTLLRQHLLRAVWTTTVGQVRSGQGARLERLRRLTCLEPRLGKTPTWGSNRSAGSGIAVDGAPWHVRTDLAMCRSASRIW